MAYSSDRSFTDVLLAFFMRVVSRPFALVALLFVSTQLMLAQLPADRDGLLNAEGMGQAKFAELNGYPGPKHVLELGDKLQLSEEQKKAVTGAYNDMATRAKEIGKQIVRIEGELNDAFARNFVNEKSVREDAEEIGRLRGKLRSVHLIAHLKTKSLLTAKQIEMYKALRGVSKEEKK